MSCEKPRARWRAGLFQPLSASLWISGVICTAVGVVLTNGLAGLLPHIGAALVLLGTSNGAVSALNLGSVFKLASGSRARAEALTKECINLQPRIEIIAQLLCADENAVRRTVGLTIIEVSREWNADLGVFFDRFLLCRTIAIARDQEAIFGPGSGSDPERENQLIKALYRLCQVPPADIATMLNRDLTSIRLVLGGSPQGDVRQ